MSETTTYFWLMLACVLICPLIILFAGQAMTRMTPDKPNPFIGYRTALSMRNEDTWYFANRDCGQKFRKSAVWLCVASAAVILFAGSAASVDMLSALVMIVVAAQCVWLVVVVSLVQRDLRRTFNDDGTRKNSQQGPMA